MTKIVFCNIAWMKDYCGITEDDKPYNGGSFVEENGDAAESCNFLPNNHYCYGYFASKGQNLNLSRVDESVGNDDSTIEGVTVIWVANRKIVGWYKNATMYRRMQEFYDDILGEDKTYWLYNFKANEKDVYLLPVELRSFDIPSATTAGTGKGMGQSNIWYADSKWAREQFVPDVLDYVRIMSSKCIQNIIRPEELSKKATSKLSVEELVRRNFSYVGDSIEDKLQHLQALNLIESKLKNPHDIYVLKYLRGNVLQNLLLYDEAVELYKQFLFDFSQLDEEEQAKPTMDYLPDLQVTHLDCIWDLASMYMAMKQYFSACSLYQKYFELEKERGLRADALVKLMYIFYDEADWQHLRETIEAYDKLELNEGEHSEEVDWYREALGDQTDGVAFNDNQEKSEDVNKVEGNPKREKIFPKSFSFKGVTFTRIDDDDKFKPPYAEAINQMWRDMQLKYKSLKLIIATYWPKELTRREANGKRRSVLEKSHYLVKINNYILPFELDMQIVDCVLTNNAAAFTAHSIFTEFGTFNYLKDFKARVKKYNLSFVVGKAESEFYIADYSKADKNFVDEYTGIITFTDEEAEATIKD